MGIALPYFERLLRWTLRQHFRIPPTAFWAGLLAGALGLFFAPGPLLLPVAGATAIALIGVVRWRHYRRGKILLVLPQPLAVEPSDPLPSRAQQLILESLATRLTPRELALVRPIPARLGPADLQLADAIRRRLRAPMILLGRIDRRADGAWSLFSGIVSSPEERLVHLDYHTRDRTPAQTTWTLILEYLSPTQDVQDVQDPLFVSAELEAIVRSLAGYVAQLSGDLDRAEREFRAAIDASGPSDAWPIDDLRCALAAVLVEQGRREDAFALLRERATRPDPSPEVFRRLARYAGSQPGDFDEHIDHERHASEKAEAIASLRRAVEVRADPKRPLSLYNLSALVFPTDPEEADRLLTEAMEASRFYRRAWYVHRALGAARYHAAGAQLQEGDPTGARRLYREAAREYAIAVRRRPKMRFWWRDRGVRYLYMRFPPSPIMYANAQDAFEGAGRPWRARWYAWRTDRLRRARIRRGNKRLLAGQWLGAYANFDFAVIGRQDFADAYAQVLRSVCLQQEDHLAEAAADFAEADTRFPGLALLLRMGCIAEDAPTLPRGLPGPWPSDEKQVFEILRRRGFMVDEEPEL